MNNQTTTEAELKKKIEDLIEFRPYDEAAREILKLIAQEKKELLDLVKREIIGEPKTRTEIHSRKEDIDAEEYRNSFRVEQLEKLQLLAHSQVDDTEERSEDREGKEE